ncbi:MAG: hypothetical protein ABR540_10170 [Acidimicrobiales bacterium]
MYEFAVLALLGLATLKVVDLVTELAPGIVRVRTLATFVLALVAIVALDHSMFSSFGVTVREAWVGTVLTGLVVGSLAGAWQAVLGYLGASGDTTINGRRSDRPRIAA